jgi:hypothetical protein
MSQTNTLPFFLGGDARSAQSEQELDNPVTLAPFKGSRDFQTRRGRALEPLAKLVGGPPSLFSRRLAGLGYGYGASDWAMYNRRESSWGPWGCR